MNRFTQYSQSQFTPLSSQEILQPAMIMRERHDKMDEQYGDLSDQASQLSFIAESASEGSRMRKDWDAYNNAFQSGTGSLSENGVTADSMRELRKAKSAYQYAAPRIAQAKDLSNSEQTAYNDAIAKDPSMIIGWNPRNAEQIYENDLSPQDTSKMVSGEQQLNRLRQIVAPMASLISDTGQLEGLTTVQFSKEFANLMGIELTSDIVDQMDRIITKGYDPRNPNAQMDALFEIAKQGVMSTSGILNWGNEQQRRQLDTYLEGARTSMIGGQQLDSVRRNNMLSEYSRELDNQRKAIARETPSVRNPNLFDGIPMELSVDNPQNDIYNIDTFSKRNITIGTDGLLVDNSGPRSAYSEIVGGGWYYKEAAKNVQKMVLADSTITRDQEKRLLEEEINRLRNGYDSVENINNRIISVRQNYPQFANASTEEVLSYMNAMANINRIQSSKVYNTVNPFLDTDNFSGKIHSQVRNMMVPENTVVFDRNNSRITNKNDQKKVIDAFKDANKGNVEFTGFWTGEGANQATLKFDVFSGTSDKRKLEGSVMVPRTDLVKDAFRPIDEFNSIKEHDFIADGPLRNKIIGGRKYDMIIPDMQSNYLAWHEGDDDPVLLIAQVTQDSESLLVDILGLSNYKVTSTQQSKMYQDE